MENLWKLKEEAECGEIEVGRAEEAFILYECLSRAGETSGGAFQTSTMSTVVGKNGRKELPLV